MVLHGDVTLRRVSLLDVVNSILNRVYCALEPAPVNRGAIIKHLVGLVSVMPSPSH